MTLETALNSLGNRIYWILSDNKTVCSEIANNIRYDEDNLVAPRFETDTYYETEADATAQQNALQEKPSDWETDYADYWYYDTDKGVGASVKSESLVQFIIEGHYVNSNDIYTSVNDILSILQPDSE